MIRIQFSQQDVQALRYERFHHPSARVQLKMEALFLKSKDLPHHVICSICEISKTTLIAYLKEYKRGGIRQLKEKTTPSEGWDKNVYPAGEGHRSICHSKIMDTVLPGAIPSKTKKSGALSTFEKVA